MQREEQRFGAVGLSMLPAIFPRDLIVVRPATRAALVRGAIVAYPGSQGRVVAHRIVETRGPHDLVIAGDFLEGRESIPPTAVAYVVVRVEGRLGTWTPDDRRGRVLERMALSTTGPYALARSAVQRLLRGALVLRRRVGGARSDSP